MAIGELRFGVPGLRFYAQGLALSALGVAFVAWGVVVVAFDPWNWAGALFLVGGVFVGVLGVAFSLLVWFIYVWGTIRTWRQWRQVRPPAVVIDASGVRYLAARKPALVPWPDIEKVGLRRTVFRNRVVTKVFLRLVPGAALLRDRAAAVSPARYLNVGVLSALAVPEDVAVRFLSQTAGSRLEITEVDRRDPVTRRGRS